MITFETELYVSELELHRKLCLMDEIVYVVVEIEYCISKFRPANWWHPEEGGILEDWNVRVVDGRFTDNQCRDIEWSLPDSMVKDAIWAHYESNKNEPDSWY